MSGDNPALLRVENLAIGVGGRSAARAVNGVSFTVRTRETLALLGESGCGKSLTGLSIMRLLPDNVRIVDGSVQLGDVDLLALPEAVMRTVRGRRVAMVFQEPALSLNPVLTVGDQIREVLDCHTTLRGAAARHRILGLLDAVGISDVSRRFDEYPFHLSGGMKQRVMIAMMLAGEPELLIADEPTTALDVTLQSQVLDLLRGLQQRTHMAILLITHDLGVVAEMAHRVAVMYAGEVVELAERDTFFANPRHPYSRKLFESLPTADKRGMRLSAIAGAVPLLGAVFAGCRFASRCDLAEPRCHDEVPPWIPLHGGGVRCHLAPLDDGSPPLLSKERCVPVINVMAPSGSPLLEVVDLKVHFPVHRGVFKRVVGRVKAVDGLSFCLFPGQTLALVGESGCGKTTAGKGLLRLIEPTGGTVRFDGDEITTLRGAALRAKRADMQIIFQDPYGSLNPRMRVADILEEGMAALHVVPLAARREVIDDLLRQVGLAVESRNHYPHEFSGGQRQRIAIARALAVKPRLIVCDEPTSALDVSIQAQILNLLKSLQETLGLAYLFITHNLAVVDYLAHRVAVMYLGRIVEQGSSEAVRYRPQHPYTQALLAAVPRLDPVRGRSAPTPSGELPSPLHPPVGCHFHPRCPRVMAVCREHYPDSVQLAAGHSVCCHLYTRGER